MSKPNLLISMPVYNEQTRIEKWIYNLSQSSRKYKTQFIVVNDASSDETSEVIRAIKFSQIDLIENLQNSGHGHSTLRGMHYALSVMEDTDILITVDGDGHYASDSVIRMADELLLSGAHVVEGLRVNRNDPLYRKITSLITRLIVFTASRKFPKDANTPFHAYTKESLDKILKEVFVSSSLIPNIHISIHLRTNEYVVKETFVVESPSTEDLPTGTTWNQKRRNLPSQRFVKFCIDAFFEIILQRKKHAK